MSRLALFLTALALAACGVDGEPQAPGAQQTSGVSVTGEASVGVVGTF